MASVTREVGVKGSDVYGSTGSALLDLSVLLVRGAAEDTIVKAMGAAALDLSGGDARRASLKELAVLMFHTRAVRGGKGERALFDILFKELYSTDPHLATQLISLIPEYGSWADVIRLIAICDGDLRVLLLNAMASQLRADEAEVSGGSISLAAKWAPREGKAGAFTARALASILFPQILNGFARMAAYRKLVAGLNRRLNTVETLMSSGHWADIVPAHVPGRAGAIYSRAFLNLPPKRPHLDPAERRCPGDPDREACREHFSAHYTRAREGEAKVHGADTLFPHEVVKRLVIDGIHDDNMSEDEKNHLVAVWRSMVEKARAGGGLRRTIFMSDFSGSMRSSGMAGDTPYWVSLALGALGAEVSTGAFANHLMTFDSTPTWHRFAEGDDIIARLRSVFANPALGQGLSTDFQAAMNLVLGTLKAGRVRPGEEPENIVVLTDMGWDAACGSSGTSLYTGARYRHAVKTEGWQTHIEMIRENFRRAGEDMWGEGQGWVPPRIVVWNLAASFAQGNHHATAETPGVVMLSGWSPTLFEVLQQEGPREVTALEMLRDELAHPRYDRVRAAVDRAFAAEA